MSLRNLYWLRELESVGGSPEREALTSARGDAQALVEITRSRELGIPTFVLGGLLVPAALSVWRLASGFTFVHWSVAVLVGVAGTLAGLGISWVVLRGAASRAAASGCPCASRCRRSGTPWATARDPPGTARGGSRSSRSR